MFRYKAVGFFGGLRRRALTYRASFGRPLQTFQKKALSDRSPLTLHQWALSATGVPSIWTLHSHIDIVI